MGMILKWGSKYMDFEKSIVKALRILETPEVKFP